MTTDNNSQEPQSASTKFIKAIMITLILILVILATALGAWLLKEHNEYKKQQRQAENRFNQQVENQLYRLAQIQDTKQAYQDYIDKCIWCNHSIQAHAHIYRLVAEKKHKKGQAGLEKKRQKEQAGLEKKRQKEQARLEEERVLAHGVRYKIHDNGTVTDKQTDLIWKRCSEGQTWTGTTCSGEASEHTWKAAQDHASGVVYAGHSDWRVPSIKELNTLIYCSNGYQITYKKDGYDDTGGCGNGSGSYQIPTINQVAFPNTSSIFFWSASPHADYSGKAWLLSFGEGHDAYGSPNFSLKLRLLRSRHRFLFFTHRW